jgi:tetratricopeptide (TPR) repeat protein
MRRVSERFHRIQGVLYMYGPGVKAGARIDGAEVLDVAPTLLALTGMPVAADMPGHVLTEALRMRAGPKRVPTYETGETATADAGSAKPASDIAPVDPAILEHLRALGYLDTASPTGDRNLASMHFEAGRYREAAEAYRKLIAEKPDDGALHASLAGTLGAMGDYDGALTELGEAEKLSPLNPEIYHNRGVILERRGKTEEAIEQYRRAVRYSPDYEPSRSALQRLTGSPIRAHRAATPRSWRPRSPSARGMRPGTATTRARCSSSTRPSGSHRATRSSSNTARTSRS